jgi:hypothetical protein
MQPVADLQLLELAQIAIEARQRVVSVEIVGETEVSVEAGLLR